MCVCGCRSTAGSWGCKGRGHSATPSPPPSCVQRYSTYQLYLLYSNKSTNTDGGGAGGGEQTSRREQTARRLREHTPRRLSPTISSASGTHFTCKPGTNVQILTQDAHRTRRAVRHGTRRAVRAHRATHPHHHQQQQQVPSDTSAPPPPARTCFTGTKAGILTQVREQGRRIRRRSRRWSGRVGTPKTHPHSSNAPRICPCLYLCMCVSM